MSMISKTALLKVITLARQAGEAIIEVYQETHSKVVLKDDQSPLTEADLRSDHILKTGLRAIIDCPYLSEESEMVSYSERSIWDHYWLVDPLDGTKEFVNKTHEFTVNIAYVENNQLMLGVVYAPALDLLYYGTRETGSYRQVKAGDIEKLPLQQPLADEFRVVMSRSHSSEAERSLITKLAAGKKISPVSKGSSIKFCLVAEGAADCYPRLGPTNEWDTAAGHAILLFSGGMVTDLEQNLPLAYNKPQLLNPGFVAFR